MEYKDYNISSAETVLMHDMLQELKEIKELLKPKIEPTVEKPQEPIAEDKPESIVVKPKEKAANKPRKRKTTPKKGKVK